VTLGCKWGACQQVDAINSKTLNSPEPRVNEMLRISRNFRATTDDAEAMDFSDVIMLVVATPSTGQDDRHYDTATLSSLLSSFNKAKLKNKHFVICCTVMPGYTRQTGRFLIRDCESCTLSYNPEFIAQGDVINGLLKPDMVLIGEGSKEAGDILETMYRNFVENSPQVKRMSPESAEITKLAINCFVTTKVAFANMIGDCADRTEGADKHAILSAVGADSVIHTHTHTHTQPNTPGGSSLVGDITQWVIHTLSHTLTHKYSASEVSTCARGMGSAGPASPGTTAHSASTSRTAASSR